MCIDFNLGASFEILFSTQKYRKNFQFEMDMRSNNHKQKSITAEHINEKKKFKTFSFFFFLDINGNPVEIRKSKTAYNGIDRK